MDNRNGAGAAAPTPRILRYYSCSDLDTQIRIEFELAGRVQSATCDMVLGRYGCDQRLVWVDCKPACADDLAEQALLCCQAGSEHTLHGVDYMGCESAPEQWRQVHCRCAACGVAQESLDDLSDDKGLCGKCWVAAQASDEDEGEPSDPWPGAVSP